MGAIRVVVPDVDDALPAYAAAGYEVSQRWGPPFAILTSADGPDLWLAGPGTTAARSLEDLAPDDAACARVRQVVEVDDVATSVAALQTAGWVAVGTPIGGPGGTQQLVRRGPVFLEVFSGR